MEKFVRLYICLCFIFIYGCDQRHEKSGQKQDPVQADSVTKGDTITGNGSVLDSRAGDSQGPADDKIRQLSTQDSDRDGKKAKEIPIMLSGKEIQETPLQIIDLERGNKENVSLSILNAAELSSPVKDKLMVRLSNFSSDTLITGIHYEVLFNENGKWIVVAPPKNVGFVDVGYSITPFSARDFMVPLFPDRVTYMPGKYRVIKKYLILNEAVPRKECEIFADFRIE